MTPLTPLRWAESFSGTPILHGEGPPGRSGLVRRWRGTEAVMVQPPLDHHYVVLHLGGPKRVTRAGDGHAFNADVADEALTFVPAGSAFTWRTEGPIDFAHLYIHPSEFERLKSRTGLRRRSALLKPRVGVSDGLLAGLIKEMLREGGRGAARDGLYVESLFNAALGVIAHRHLDAASFEPEPGSSVSPARLRRVLELIEADLSGPLSVAQLSATAGLSSFHFSRVFSQALGVTPAAYVERRRIEAALRLLSKGDLSVGEVARRTGFRSASHFGRRFRLATGLRPSEVRAERNGE